MGVVTPLRVGSLCSGYGGLEMGLAEVLDAELDWVADNDPGAAKILAHHHPDVPNLGDLTQVRWQDVTRVDVLCGGFPCQDISYAGLGAGIKEGNRSGLWYTIADALGVLRPQLVVLENVAGIVARRPGLDVVLADLARLRFDANWTCLRASDAGAPHGRDRWFLVARNTDGVAGETGVSVNRGCRAMGEPGTIKRVVGPDRISVPDTDGGSLAGQQECDSQAFVGQAVNEHCLDTDGCPVDWGRYRPAIRRWEHITGRRAPDPRVPAPGGGRRLSPVFVEWLMGLPAGHVTAVPGLKHTAQLHALGNGVVPQQAAAAFRLLLPAVLDAQRESAA